MNRLIAVFLVLFLSAGVFFLQLKIDRLSKIRFHEKELTPIFPKPSLLRPLSLGHINLTADYYWLKTIQYLGGKIEKKEIPNQIWEYANFITELAPRFFEAYYYPSIIMIVYRLDFHKNLALLEKGIKNLPPNKEIPFLLGFVNYYFLEDYQKAADYFYQASRLSGYKGYAILASRILAEKGNLELSQTLLSEIARGSENTRWHKPVLEMLKGIEQRRHLDFLDQKIELFRERYGREPMKIQELVQAQLLTPQELPSDPLGGEYYIDPITHKARSTKEYYLGVYRPKEFQK